jgi:hypothetical protein
LDEAPRLLRPKEVIDILRVTRETLRVWAKHGLLDVVLTMGGHRRYAAADVEQLIGRRPQIAGTWLYPLVAAAEPQQPRCTHDHDTLCVVCQAWARYDAVPETLRAAVAEWAAER